MTRTQEIIKEIRKIIPNLECELIFKNNYELLCAVMLSAQTTDKAVNKVTEILFNQYDSPFKLKDAEEPDIEKIIRPIGLSKVKSRNLISLSKKLCDSFNGVVPNDLENLMSLPGVGRKTANVVLALGFEIPSIPVDTHVKRVSIRLQIAKKDSSEIEVEKELMNGLNKDEWIDGHHALLLFGRYYCLSKNPKCENCKLIKHCCFNT